MNQPDEPELDEGQGRELTVGAWREYLEAAHRLDAVRRQAAGAVAAEQAALRTAREELAAMKARLALQQQRIAEVAAQAGSAVDLSPTPGDAQMAQRAVTGGPAVVLAALRQARTTVDIADGALAQHPGRPLASVRRNLRIYGAMALVAVVLQVGFVSLVDARTQPLYAGCTGFLLALVSFGIGWTIAGVVSRSRTPALGFLICALPLLLSTVVYTVLWLS